MYGFLGFDFLSLELGIQTENKIVFKINLNCGVFCPKMIRDLNLTCHMYPIN
jgi:hypothetical protein